MDLTGDHGMGDGMAKRGVPVQGVTSFVGVDSLDDYLAKAEELGGRVVQPKMEVPSYGWTAVLLDTESNPIRLWQDV